MGLRLSDADDRMPWQLTQGVRSHGFSVVVDEISAPGWTLDDFNADDVELVELYPPGPNFAVAMRAGASIRRSQPPTSISSARGAGAGTMGMPGASSVARIWLRR
jgi:hypothetical protein